MAYEAQPGKVSNSASTDEASRSYFNRWARRYDTSPARIWFRKNYRLMASVFDPSPSAHILDVGCGTGRLASHFAQRVPGGRVLGVDAAEEMINVSRQRSDTQANLRFTVARSDALPVRDAAFDLVFSTISFHHWTRPAESIAELERVLRPGGRLAILDLCSDNPLVHWLDRILHRLQGAHHRIASAAEMRHHLGAAGLQNVRITKPRLLLMLARGTKGMGDGACAMPTAGAHRRASEPDPHAFPAAD